LIFAGAKCQRMKVTLDENQCLPLLLGFELPESLEFELVDDRLDDRWMLDLLPVDLRLPVLFGEIRVPELFEEIRAPEFPEVLVYDFREFELPDD
jgi:hypothetical protein